MFNLKSCYYFMFLLLLKSSYFLYKVEVKIISSIDIQGLNANNLVKKNILRVNRNKLRVGRKYKIKESR